MKEECLRLRKPPDLAPGDVLHDGTFLRNVGDEHVAKRVERDSNTDTVYGLRERWAAWPAEASAATVALVRARLVAMRARLAAIEGIDRKLISGL